MKTRFILFFILILALGLRLPHLLDKEYGTDEEASIYDAKLIKDSSPFTYFFSSIPYELSPPVFFHILALALIAYDSVITLKILMVVFGMLGIIVFYLLAKNLFNERFALFATFLYAVNPMHIIYSQHIRSYIFIFLLYTLSLYFMHKFLFKKDSQSLIYLGITYVLAAYTHYWTMLFMAVGFVTVLLFYYLDKDTKIKQYIIFGIIIFILAIPALLLLQEQFSIHNALGITNLWPTLTPKIVPYPFWKYSVMTDVSTTLDNFPYLFAMFPILIGISIYGAYLLYKRKKKECIFIVSSLSAPFIIYTSIGFVWPVYSFRYITYLLIPYVLLYSYGLFNVKNKALRIALIITLLAGWTYIIYYYYDISQFYLWSEHIAV